jgi:hypothetical protein
MLGEDRSASGPPWRRITLAEIKATAWQKHSVGGFISTASKKRPQLASPPGGAYRARKFLRRQRTAAFRKAAGLAFILLGGVTVRMFAHRDSPRRRPALTEGDDRSGRFR